MLQSIGMYYPEYSSLNEKFNLHFLEVVFIWKQFVIYGGKIFYFRDTLKNNSWSYLGYITPLMKSFTFTAEWMYSFSSLKDAKMCREGICSNGNKVRLRIKRLSLPWPESKFEKFLNPFEPVWFFCFFICFCFCFLPMK